MVVGGEEEEEHKSWERAHEISMGGASEGEAEAW